MTESFDGRCGTCARFVRAVEIVDRDGQAKRAGECLLGVWPAPIYENNTCTRYARRGEAKAVMAKEPRHVVRTPRIRGGAANTNPEAAPPRPRITQLPEELLDMDMDQFRQVLREVIQDELGMKETPLGARWEGGEVILKPGKEGTQEKRIPIDALFHKVVMIRDKLRVLEQKVNSHPKLSDEEKVQMQSYVTGCYGTLTTFNVLFADKDDQFVGQKGDG